MPKHSAIVRFQGRPVVFPCAVSLHTIVEEPRRAPCYAEVTDDTGRRIDRFYPTEEEVAGGIAEAAVLAQAKALVERLEEARTSGSMAVAAATGGDIRTAVVPADDDDLRKERTRDTLVRVGGIVVALVVVSIVITLGRSAWRFGVLGGSAGGALRWALIFAVVVWAVRGLRRR